MTEYDQTVDWLFNQVPMFQNVGANAYKPGLDGVLSLSNAFGNPHKGLKTVHVGGTNGKGSVSSIIASVLQESGLRVGLYTSPHLVDFRERIRIGGEMIPHEAVVDFISRYRSMELPFEPSFFELTTVMAFDWFSRNNVDIAVIEVGLGGRLDSTNIITPIISIITNISYDHTAQLGDTLEAISGEKAGIIKPEVPAVIGRAEGNVRKVFEARANDMVAPVIFASDNNIFSEAKKFPTHYIYSDTPWGDICCPLSGDCQPENAATALTALQIINKYVQNMSFEAVRNGFRNVCRNTGLIGRWTTISKNPLIICDTGHNPGGWQWLGPKLRDMAAQGQLHMVIGFVNDKDVTAIMAEMPTNATYYFATPSVKRGRNSEELRLLALSAGLDGEAYPTVKDAVMAALAAASPDDTIFVGGSTFIVADLLTLMANNNDLIA